MRSKPPGQNADEVRAPEIADRGIDLQPLLEGPEPSRRHEIFERPERQRQSRHWPERMEGCGIFEPAARPGRIERGLERLDARRGQEPRQAVHHTLRAARSGQRRHQQQNAHRQRRAIMPVTACGTRNSATASARALARPDNDRRRGRPLPGPPTRPAEQRCVASKSRRLRRQNSGSNAELLIQQQFERLEPRYDGRPQSGRGEATGPNRQLV